MKNKTVLVTGLTGFVGSHLLERLIGEGYKVVGIKSQDFKTWRIEKLKDKVLWYGSSQSQIDKAFRENQVRAVMHLATKYVKSNESKEEVEQMIETNLKLGMNLVEACLKYKTKQLVNTGSFFEYKLKKGKIKEGDEKRPYNLYAGFKSAWSQVLKFYAYQGKLAVVDMKLFAPFGEKDNDKLMQFLIKALKTGKKIKFSGGEQRWNFTYVTDIVSALMLGLKEVNGYQEYCVGYERAVSIRQVVKILEKVSGKRLKIKWGEKPYVKNEIMYVNCDNAKLRRLGWKPKFKLESGLRRTYNYNHDND